MAATVVATPNSANPDTDALACIDDAGNGGVIQVTFQKPIQIDALGIAARAEGSWLHPTIEIETRTFTPGNDLVAPGAAPFSTVTVRIDSKDMKGARTACVEHLFLGAAGPPAKRIEPIAKRTSAFLGEIEHAEENIRVALTSAKPEALAAVIAFPLEWKVDGSSIVPGRENDDDSTFKNARELAAWLRKNPWHGRPLPSVSQFDKTITLSNGEDACTSWSWSLEKRGKAWNLIAVRDADNRCDSGE